MVKKIILCICIDVYEIMMMMKLKIKNQLVKKCEKVDKDFEQDLYIRIAGGF